MCGQTIGSGAQLVGYDKSQNDTAVHAAIPVHAGLNGNPGAVSAPSDESAAAGSQPAPVPAGQKVLFKYIMCGAEMRPILSAAVHRCSRVAEGRSGQ